MLPLTLLLNQLDDILTKIPKESVNAIPGNLSKSLIMATPAAVWERLTDLMMRHLDNVDSWGKELKIPPLDLMAVIEVRPLESSISVLL